MSKPAKPEVDETNLTEITFQPDGRIYVFGASRNVLDLLAELQPNDERLQRLLATVQPAENAGEDPPP